MQVGLSPSGLAPDAPMTNIDHAGNLCWGTRDPFPSRLAVHCSCAALVRRLRQVYGNYGLGGADACRWRCSVVDR